MKNLGPMFLVACLLIAAGCRPRSREVVVYTSVDQVFVEPVLKDFESRTGIHVRAVYDTEEAKSTGVFNRLIAEAAHPQADVFWSGDPVRATLLKRKGMLASYWPPHADRLANRYKDPDGAWTGFSARARILLVNQEKVKGNLPHSYWDLADPRWKGQAALANPLFGTATFHIAALFHALGDQDAKAFMQKLKTNEVRILPSNGDVKNAVVNGEASFGFADTDDAHDAIQASGSVVAVLPDQESIGTLLIPNTLSLIKNSPDPENGKKLIDFLLTDEVEVSLAKSAAQIPLLGRARIPPSFPVKVDRIRDMDIDYNDLAQTLDSIGPYLKQWSGL